jgi:hypothetical protein
MAGSVTSFHALFFLQQGQGIAFFARPAEADGPDESGHGREQSSRARPGLREWERSRVLVSALFGGVD